MNSSAPFNAFSCLPWHKANHMRFGIEDSNHRGQHHYRTKQGGWSDSITWPFNALLFETDAEAREAMTAITIRPDRLSVRDREVVMCHCCHKPAKAGPEKYPWHGRPLIECIRLLTVAAVANPLSQQAAADELGISRSALRREVTRHKKVFKARVRLR